MAGKGFISSNGNSVVLWHGRDGRVWQSGKIKHLGKNPEQVGKSPKS